MASGFEKRVMTYDLQRPAWRDYTGSPGFHLFVNEVVMNVFAKFLLALLTFCIAALSPASAQNVAQGRDVVLNPFCTGACTSGDYQLAADAAGNALAIWTQENGRLVTTRLDAATGRWTLPESLGNQTGHDPRIGFDRNGNAIATWIVDDNEDCQKIIRYSRYLGAQKSWTRPELVRSFQCYEGAYAPVLAVSGNGDAFLAVIQRNEAGAIFRFDSATTTWQMYEYTGGGQEHAIAADDSGNAIYTARLVVYVNFVYAIRFDASTGQWSDSERFDEFIEDGSGFSQFLTEPSVTMDRYGNGMVMWQKGTSKNGGAQTRVIRSARYLVRNNGWTLKTLPKVSNALVDQSVMSADARTNVTAVWTQALAGTTRVFSSRYSAASGKWSRPVVIQQGDFQSRYPALDTDRFGDVLATWSQRMDTGTQSPGNAVFRIMASRFSAATGTWCSPIVVQDANRKGYRSRIAANDSGGAVVLWEQKSSRSLGGVPIRELVSDRLFPAAVPPAPGPLSPSRQ